ncbi:MAG: D-alanyl-D-alanine carboxypeptidase [Verrucomicrobiales bacterium]|nr:D-alanyl-D-alanine carboxypeptidase [Verrucomicrobiales bacterium]
MNRRLRVARFFRNVRNTSHTVLLIISMAVLGCQSHETPAVATPQAPVGASQYPEGGNQGSRFPFSPVPANPDQVAQTAPPPSSKAEPNITAKAAILVDGWGRVIYEKNADQRLPSASTQKLLLGILVAERGNLNGSMTIEEPDTWAEPTIMGIKPGQVYTRGELLKAVLIRSSNDIARALARDHSGSVSNFAGAMNQRARSLGMTNSYFTNASGLPTPPGQYSTARDLSKLGLAALRKPVIRDAVQTKTHTFRFSNGTTKSLSNTNQVLKHFPYCTGLKTGYTNAAGRCLISSASGNGRSVVAVILGSTSPAVWSESEALLRYGLGI